MLTVSITSLSAAQIVIGSSSTASVMEQDTGMTLLLCVETMGGGLSMDVAVSFTVSGKAGRLLEMLSL